LLFFGSTIGQQTGKEMGIGKYFNQAQREALLAATLSGVTGMATVGLLYAHNKPLIFLSGVLVAITSFFWRIRFRFIYGLIELAFGLYVLWYVADKGRGSFSAAFSTGFDTFQLSVVLIQTFGAIYILIRSFDNLLQGLPTYMRVSIETRLQQWHV
jgi:hypothetical protein